MLASTGSDGPASPAASGSAVGGRVTVGLAALCCAALWLSVLGPGLTRLGSHFLGEEYVDHYGTQWFYWYTERQLRNGEGLDHTSLFFHPYGKDIFGHTGSNVLDGILAIPFRVLLGPVAGYNVFVLVGLLASAWAFYALLSDWVADRGARLLAAGLFGLSPFVLHDLAEGRPTQAILLPVVLFVRQLLRCGHEDRWRPAVLAGLWLAVAGFQYWFYAIFAGLCAVGHGLAAAAAPPRGSGGAVRILSRHALAAAVALLLTAPVALPMVLAATEEGAVPGLLDTRAWSLSYTPPVTMEGLTIGLFTWQPFLRMSGFHILSDENVEMFLAQNLLLPWFWAPLLLVFFLLRRTGDEGPPRLPLLAMALVAMALATGSMVLVGSLALPNPPFILLTHAFDVMRRLWWPARALAVLVIVIGLATAVLLARAGRRGRLLQGGLMVALTGLSLGEIRAAGHLPLDTWDADIPAGYECLAQGPEGALIELPYVWNQAHLYYQTAHGRPIMGGMLEDNEVFTPEEITDLREDNAFLVQLRTAAATGSHDGEFDQASATELRDLGYRYIVVQKDAYQSSTISSARGDSVARTRQRRLKRGLEDLMGEPVYDDARVAIYAPFGDPRPCSEDAVTRDERPRLSKDRGRLDAGKAAMTTITMRRPGTEVGVIPGVPDATD